MSDAESSRRLAPMAFALLVGGGVGFMTASSGRARDRFAIGFVALAGFGMARATAHTKLLNFTSNIASLLFFALGARWCGASASAWRWASSSAPVSVPKWCSSKGSS